MPAHYEAVTIPGRPTCVLAGIIGSSRAKLQLSAQRLLMSNEASDTSAIIVRIAVALPGFHATTKDSIQLSSFESFVIDLGHMCEGTQGFLELSGEDGSFGFGILRHRDDYIVILTHPAMTAR